MDVSIDIETLSSRPNALITQIGACLFDRKTSHVSETFLANVSYEDVWDVSEEFHVDPNTVNWWLTQSDEARLSLSAPAPTSINMVLDSLYQWLRDHGFKKQNRDINQLVWANSPSFDCVILQHAMRVFSIPCPWHFRQERDFRTIVSLAEEFTAVDKLIINDSDLIKHRADHDAIRQARIISLASQLLVKHV